QWTPLYGAAACESSPLQRGRMNGRSVQGDPHSSPARLGGDAGMRDASKKVWDAPRASVEHPIERSARTGARFQVAVKGGRRELLVPHIVRGQLFRPGFVRLSLRLGAARQMPAWAKLQFTNGGVSAEDLDEVLGRVRSLESWVDAWQDLGRRHET